jgi:hypothetical protein
VAGESGGRIKRVGLIRNNHAHSILGDARLAGKTWA